MKETLSVKPIIWSDHQSSQHRLGNEIRSGSSGVRWSEGEQGWVLTGLHNQLFIYTRVLEGPIVSESFSFWLLSGSHYLSLVVRHCCRKMMQCNTLLSISVPMSIPEQIWMISGWFWRAHGKSRANNGSWIRSREMVPSGFASIIVCLSVCLSVSQWSEVTFAEYVAKGEQLMDL